MPRGSAWRPVATGLLAIAAAGSGGVTSPDEDLTSVVATSTARS